MDAGKHSAGKHFTYQCNKERGPLHCHLGWGRGGGVVTTQYPVCHCSNDLNHSVTNISNLVKFVFHFRYANN